jgi:hypothetical protein
MFSDNRFSARADPPGGGLVAGLATQGGSFALCMTPLVGWGGGGWPLAKTAENRPLQVF